MRVKHGNRLTPSRFRVSISTMVQYAPKANSPGSRVSALGFIVVLLFASGCSHAVSPPAGVPETPYWYSTPDSVFWYLPAESLAVAQFREGTPPNAVQEVLYKLRELGWRMTVARGPALQRAGEEQSLSQRLYQLERVDNRAVSPAKNWRKFRRFWPSEDEPAALMGMIPGLLEAGKAPPKYYWPNCLCVVWSDKATEKSARAWLDSLGCRLLSTPQFTQQYYVQRAWATELPAGGELFVWLRKLNADDRVSDAHPIMAMYEPPYPDFRRVTKASQAKNSEPEEFRKMSPLVRRSYHIAQFAGSALQAANVTNLPRDGASFHVDITMALTSTDDSLLVVKHSGRVISSSSHRISAWIPYQELPALATESAVKTIAEPR